MITAAQARTWARIDAPATDLDILAVINAAAGHVQKYTGVSCPAVDRELEVARPVGSCWDFPVAEPNSLGKVTALYAPTAAAAAPSEELATVELSKWAVRSLRGSTGKAAFTRVIAPDDWREAFTGDIQGLVFTVNAGRAVNKADPLWVQATKQIFAELWDNRAGGPMPSPSAIDLICAPIKSRVGG